jgi:membrane protease subunit (stomatin/prohibitin family)
MGIMDFIKGELLEIIEWTDDSRDTLSWRFPDDDKAVKNGAQLIVRESQVAQFVYVGEFGDTFTPGKHTLTTDNIPVLTKIKSWPFGFNSPFKADVYFVTTRLFTGNKWGTSNPVMLRDTDFGIVRVRSFGTYDFKIVDPKTFLREVAGSDHNFRLDEFADTMRSRVVSIFTDAIASAKVPVLDVASRYTELGDALLPLINPAVIAKYGLELTSFIIENVSVPPEVEAAIDKRSSMGAIGNLNDFVKYQMAKGFEAGGGGGAAGTAAELAVGFGLAREMMQQGFTGGQATPTVAPPPLPGAAVLGGAASGASGAGTTPGAGTGAATTGLPELLSPADAATALGVSEADVMSVLESGDLKGKKIGASWRVTRAALTEYLTK